MHTPATAWVHEKVRVYNNMVGPIVPSWQAKQEMDNTCQLWRFSDHLFFFVHIILKEIKSSQASILWWIGTLRHSAICSKWLPDCGWQEEEEIDIVATMKVEGRLYGSTCLDLCCHQQRRERISSVSWCSCAMLGVSVAEWSSQLAHQWHTGDRRLVVMENRWILKVCPKLQELPYYSKSPNLASTQFFIFLPFKSRCLNSMHPIVHGLLPAM